MSYRSRLYNLRNIQSPEGHDKPFFSKNQEKNSSENKGAFFQAKLAVNKPGDQYEREADSMANVVVNNRTANPVLQHKKISSIQRLSTAPEEEKVSTNDQRMDRDKEKPFQRMSADPEKEKLKGIQKMDDPIKEKENMAGIQKMDDPMKEQEEKKKTPVVQRQQDATASNTSSVLSSKIESSSGKGNALPKNTLHEMNSAFGVDFSNVRLHHDSEAANMNKELNAQAFTHGNDVYFNQGKFDPDSTRGKFLLAHELTHVVQQGKEIAPFIQQKAVCPDIPHPQIPPECQDPFKRRCGSGNESDMTTYIYDPETDAYQTCSYEQYICECYDKNPNEKADDFNILNPITWFQSDPKVVAAYKGWAHKNDND